MITKEDSDWIANPACDSPSEDEKFLIEHRDEIEVIGEVHDAEVDYSYDDFALVSLRGNYYLLNTAGCSCPDPCNTWGIVHGPVSLVEMREHVCSFEGRSKYEVTSRQFAEFVAMVVEAEKRAS